MREPKMENVLHSLEVGAYATEKVFDNQTSEDMLKELWYFLHPDRVEDLYGGIVELPEENKEKVVESLISLYPWSKNIVEKLLDGYQTKPEIFLYVFDKDRGLLSKMKEIIESVVGCQADSHINLQEYDDELKKLDGEIEEKNNTINQMKEKNESLEEKRRMLEDLKNEVAKLEETDDDVKFKEKKKALIEKKIQYENKRDEQARELQKIIDEVNEIKESIKEDSTVRDELEERLPKGKYEDVMRQLEELLADD